MRPLSPLLRCCMPSSPHARVIRSWGRFKRGVKRAFLAFPYLIALYIAISLFTSTLVPAVMGVSVILLGLIVYFFLDKSRIKLGIDPAKDVPGENRHLSHAAPRLTMRSTARGRPWGWFRGRRRPGRAQTARWPPSTATIIRC